MVQLKTNAKTEADKLLVKKTEEGIGWRFGEVFSKKNIERTEYELNTIIQMGFSDYFLIVQDFLDVGRRIGYMPKDRIDYLAEHVAEMSIADMQEYINADQSMPGMTIGPGRGSAAGSLVTYLLGITSVNPLTNDLLFERFLNPERVSMPDIDSDLSKSEYEYGVRDIVIEYVKKKYGHDGVCGIVTPSTLAPKEAIKSMARICGSKRIAELKKTQEVSTEEEENIRQYYLKAYGYLANAVPNEPKIAFGKPVAVECDSTLEEDLRDKIAKTDIEPNLAGPLERFNTGYVRTGNELRADLSEILDFAVRVEGLNKNYGKHACGEIIADNGHISSYAPMLWNPKYGWEIQMNAEDAEASGLLKMDFLGLKNLNIITKVLRMIYENEGKKVDVLNLPEEPAVYREVYSKGYTNAVFQFESDGMKNMLKKFRPTSFADVVLLVACYRPGPMQYLDGIIARKHGQPADENAVTKIAGYCDWFRAIVSPTYFALVYQEQIMQVFRGVGYSMGGADNVRRAMGHKKMDILVAEKQNFIYGNEKKAIQGAIKSGITEEDATNLFDEMIDFAKYSFNKSHAAAYAMLGYITAYLKFHYPAEFYSSALNFSPLSKYPKLINEAKEFGVTVKGPDINKSESGFSEHDGVVYFGYSGIKGMGTTTVERKKYSSFADFIKQTDIAESKIQMMIQSGVFDCFSENRAALSTALLDYSGYKETIKKAEKELEQKNAMKADLENGIALDRAKYKIKTKSLPTKASLDKRIKVLNGRIQDAYRSIDETPIPYRQVYENTEKKLAAEKELLGVYVSGHPLDAYGAPSEHGCKNIGSTETGYMKLFGMVSDIRMSKRRSDGKSMCFFTLEDQTGSISVCCFTAAYEKYGSLIKEGAVLKLAGVKKEQEDDNDIISQEDEEEKEVSYEFTIDSKSDNTVTVGIKRGRAFLGTCNGIEELPEIVSKASLYASQYGNTIHILDKTSGEIYKLAGFFSDELLEHGDSLVDRNDEEDPGIIFRALS